MLIRVKSKFANNVEKELDLSPVTLISGFPGIGKSLILKVVYGLLSGIGNDLNSILMMEGNVELTFNTSQWRVSDINERLSAVNLPTIDGMLTIAVARHENAVEQVIRTDKGTLLVSRRGAEGSFIKVPLDVEVKDAGLFLSAEGLSLKGSNAVQLIDEFATLYETVMDVVRFMSRQLANLRVYYLGPYFDFPPVSKISGKSWVGTHGEYTVEVLARLSMEPRMDGKIRFLRKAIDGLGYRRLRAGLVGDGIGITYVDKNNNEIMGGEVPCSLKTILAITTQLMASEAGSIVLIDNMDYCLDEKTSAVLASLLRELGAGKQIIGEIHTTLLSNSVDSNYVTIHTVG
jgi:predicted ATPase